MAFPAGGVCDGADHSESTASEPSSIGVTCLGGDREQRLFHAHARPLRGGQVD